MRKRYTFPPDAVYNLGKKKARITKAITLLQQVKSDAVGYRQNLGLILDIEKLVPRLEEWRKDLEL